MIDMQMEYYSQEETLEILKKIDEICRKNDVKYSLAFGTLCFAYKKQGFNSDQHSAAIMMFGDEYEKFLEICNKELKMPYYIDNYRTDMKNKFSYTIFSKRSKVRLPQNRIEDQKHYDYGVVIYPVIPIANTIEEYENIINSYIRYKNILDANSVGEKLDAAKKKFYIEVIQKLLKEDKDEARRKINSIIEKKVQNAKYCMIPIEVLEEDEKLSPNRYATNRKMSKGCLMESDTYIYYTEMKFEGYNFMVIKRYEEWLLDYYGERVKEEEYGKNKEGNLILLKGHEERRRMQLIQLELLQEVKRICDKHQIKYCIMSGTLLGAVRHKGFIPWDYDADVAMLKPEYDKFISAAEKELDESKFYISVNMGKDISIHNVYARIGNVNTDLAIHKERINEKKEGISIDIFPVFAGANSYFGNRVQTYFCNKVFKPMAWAHNRAKALPWKKKNIKYKLMRYVPLKWSYSAYMYFATRYENKKTDKCSWLMGVSNPYDIALTRKESYEKLVEIEFEGDYFLAPYNYEEVLKDIFGEFYMDFPVPRKRWTAHNYYFLDTGDVEIDITSGMGEESYDD